LSVNPSLRLKLDLIDPLRGNEIKIAKLNYEVAQNNYDIKKRDLIQEARSRYHDLQKSYQDVLNKEITLDLSIQSLKDAESKLETGIGTKFEVLEANAQLTRDKQFLNEKKIQQEINKLALKEILNIKEDFVIEELQRGYHLEGKVLRHALVKVSMGPGKQNSQEEVEKDTVEEGIDSEENTSEDV